MQVCGLLSFLSANFGLENNDFRDNATLGLVVFLRYEERERVAVVSLTVRIWSASTSDFLPVCPVSWGENP